MNRPQFIKQVISVSLAALAICLAMTTRCRAQQWWEGVDEHPRKIPHADAWQFSIKVPYIPFGQLIFAGSEFEFASFTPWMAVDYKYNKFSRTVDLSDGIDESDGLDFSDERGFLGVAPTLFNLRDGYIHGWNLADLNDGTFSGVIYSPVRPTAVFFRIAADYLVAR